MRLLPQRPTPAAERFPARRRRFIRRRAIGDEERGAEGVAFRKEEGDKVVLQ
jgi:hypothetical protein